MKIVGMIPVYNEKDMISETIDHLLSQGLQIVVLDNGSTDGSYEICKKYADEEKIKLRQFKTSTFNFTLILRILYDMALTLDPDWLIRSDQDEILESGVNDVTLKKAIEDEDAKGNNLIQFDAFEFFRTDNDNETADSIKRKFPYYSWQHDYAYRSWKHIPGTRVEDAAGHCPFFPEGHKYLIPEQKFVLRHYRFRDQGQAIRNNTVRLERTKNIPERKIGWYAHLDKISKKKYYESIDHKLLSQYKEDNKWSFERKFQPFVSTSHNKREELFSKEGDILVHHQTIPEMWASLEEKNKKINEIQKKFEELKDIKNTDLLKSDSDDVYQRGNTNSFLIITGMHRSGTSFLARSFNLAGVYLGDLESIVTHDWKTHEHNLRGHWENTRLLQLGVETLSANNGSWKDVPDKIKISEGIGNEIKKTVTEITSHPSLFAGFKHPQSLLYLEAWRPYLPKELMIIGIFRHPLKVSESLKKRNDLSYENSLDLWKTYNEKLLDNLEKYGGFLINFDWPKEKIISELNIIFQKLGLSNNVNLEEWYTDELKSDNTFDSTFELSSEIDEIYSKLLNRSEKNIKVKIEPAELSKNNLKAIIDELLLDLQKQGMYFKKNVNQNVSISKTSNEKIDPLTLLLSIYYKREDLQNEFPEVQNGRYSNLSKWAKNVCKNKKDGSFNELEKFKEFYLEGTIDNNELKISFNKTQGELNTLSKKYEEQTNELKLKDEENKIKKLELEKIQKSFTWKILRKVDKIMRR